MPHIKFTDLLPHLKQLLGETVCVSSALGSDIGFYVIGLHADVSYHWFKRLNSVATTCTNKIKRNHVILKAPTTSLPSKHPLLFAHI